MAERKWHKSSFSGGNNGDCVEVSVAPTDTRVRDSKNVAGPQIVVSLSAWRQFIASETR